MNKTEMAERLAKKCGRRVQLSGFGTFGTKRRAARQGRNPATGATITIPAKEYPYFKAAKGLKDRVSD
jgi:DNA-binding protein HU-beta